MQKQKRPLSLIVIIVILVAVIILVIFVSNKYNLIPKIFSNISNTVGLAAGNGCTDTDGGKNYYVKGTVKTTWSFTDSCSTNNKLYEWYCKSGGISMLELYACPNGCENGACKSAPQYTCGCSDTNVDGWISPIDSLTLVNLINSTPTRANRCTGGSAYDVKKDVNKDGCINETDTQCVIIDLNTNGSRQTTCGTITQPSITVLPLLAGITVANGYQVHVI